MPYLQKSDLVHIRLTQYENNGVRYHVNVVFLSAVGKPKWLYAPNDPRDRLFDWIDPSGIAHHPQPLEFTYGVNDLDGVPIVIIVPEDNHAGNLDPGARRYVESNLGKFTQMAQSSNSAANDYTWFQSVVQGLNNGAMSYPTGASRAIDLAKALGASNPSSCFPPTPSPGATPTPGPTPDQGAIQRCVYSQLNSLVPSPLPSAAPATSANFLGVVIGAALPAVVTPYLKAANLVINLFGLFGMKGRASYEYLPAALYPETLGPNGDDVSTLIQPIAPPGVYPNEPVSDVVFFTIGALDQSGQRPSVQFSGDAAQRSLCANDDKIVVPFSLDKGSLYLHNARLTIRPVSGFHATRHVSLDQRDSTNPIIYREKPPATSPATPAPYLNDGGASAYDIALGSDYGFETVKQSAIDHVTVAVPTSASWKVTRTGVTPAGATLVEV